MFLKKIQYKGYSPILLTGIPVEFYDFQKMFADVAESHCQPNSNNKYKFAISFVSKQIEVEWISVNILSALDEDAVFWIAYPKKTSKKFKSDVTRDYGWDSLKIKGYEGVSMIAIDNDWSALRFKHTSKIKSKMK